LIIADLPYGTTSCEWDSAIDLKKLWPELNRICKKNAAMIFTAQQPFAWRLCASNPNNFKYELIWEKPNATNPFHAKTMPMKAHEDILIFYRKQPTYNPQMVKGKPYVWDSTRTKGEASSLSITGINERIESDGWRYPKSVIDCRQDRGLHPTQKPVKLFAYLIKTYSNPGDTVLDCTMGSGTTGVAAKETGRKFVGIEIEDKYFKIACERIRLATRIMEIDSI
jgi:site-specific DNA-methyltransferase (adenine-specific)